MTVKKAKKMLKAEMSDRFPDRKLYIMVRWWKKHKCFLVEDMYGARMRLMF